MANGEKDANETPGTGTAAAKPNPAAKSFKDIAGLKFNPEGDMLLEFKVSLIMKDGGVIKFGGGGTAEGAVIGGGADGSLLISVPVSGI